jgi:hypothetical protein
MDNPFTALEQALIEARRLERACEQSANTMADLLEGNLRRLSSYRLKKLKKELEKFNIRTGFWKD